MVLTLWRMVVACLCCVQSRILLGFQPSISSFLCFHERRRSSPLPNAVAS